MSTAFLSEVISTSVSKYAILRPRAHKENGKKIYVQKGILAIGKDNLFFHSKKYDYRIVNMKNTELEKLPQKLSKSSQSKVMSILSF